MAVRVIGLILFFLVLYVDKCRADENLIVGSTIVPISNCNVQLLEEEIHISKDDKVNAVYTLLSLGTSELVCKMGLPISTGETMADMQVWDDGQPVKIIKHQLLAKGELSVDNNFNNLSEDIFVWDVKFVPQTTKKIKSSYRVNWGALWRDDRTAPHIVFMTKTSALWKNHIVQSKYAIHLNDFVTRLLTANKYKDMFFTPVVYPAGYRIVNNIVEWTYHNWKPVENLSVFILEKDLIASERSAIKQFLESYEYDFARIEKGIKAKYPAEKK